MMDGLLNVAIVAHPGGDANLRFALTNSSSLTRPMRCPQ